MRAFKFLEKPKRPILDSLLTEEDITVIREYCVDIARNDCDNLIEYYPYIGLLGKSFLGGVLSRISINFYPSSRDEISRIHMEIDVSTRGISYVFTVRYMDVVSLSHSTFEYAEIYEQI